MQGPPRFRTLHSVQVQLLSSNFLEYSHLFALTDTYVYGSAVSVRISFLPGLAPSERRTGGRPYTRALQLDEPVQGARGALQSGFSCRLAAIHLLTPNNEWVCVFPWGGTTWLRPCARPCLCIGGYHPPVRSQNEPWRPFLNGLGEEPGHELSAEA